MLSIDRDLIYIYNSKSRLSALNMLLVVDGETYGCVNSFSYLGHTLDGDGGCPLCQK